MKHHKYNTKKKRKERKLKSYKEIRVHTYYTAVEHGKGDIQTEAELREPE